MMLEVALIRMGTEYVFDFPFLPQACVLLAMPEP